MPHCGYLDNDISICLICNINKFTRRLSYLNRFNVHDYVVYAFEYMWCKFFYPYGIIKSSIFDTKDMEQQIHIKGHPLQGALLSVIVYVLQVINTNRTCSLSLLSNLRRTDLDKCFLWKLTGNTSRLGIYNYAETAGIGTGYRRMMFSTITVPALIIMAGAPGAEMTVRPVAGSTKDEW